MAVLSKDVDLDALPATTPAAVTALIRRSLARDPKRRLRDIGDARHQLDDAAAGPVVGPTDPAGQWASSNRRRRPLLVALVAIAVASEP